MNTIARVQNECPSPNLAVIIPSANPENLYHCLKALQQHEPYLGAITVWSGMRCPYCRSVRIENYLARMCCVACRAGLDDDPLKREGFSVKSFPGLGFLPTVVIPAHMPFVFAQAVNAGIKHANALGEPEGYIILNDDAILKTPGGFTSMYWQQKMNPQYGIVGAVTNIVGNKNQNPQRSPGLRYEPRMVCFIAVYIPRAAMEALAEYDLVHGSAGKADAGMLDEQFTDYGMEDDDYCERMRRAGLKVGIFDGCYVDHGVLKSHFAESEHRRDFKPNLRRYIQKWGVDNRGKGREESEWADLFD